jgi:hypothetical protein
MTEITPGWSVTSPDGTETPTIGWAVFDADGNIVDSGELINALPTDTTNDMTGS